MPPTRFETPDCLVGATAFARDDAVRGGMNVIRLVKANRWLWRDLRETCNLDHHQGRRRERGCWELVAVAFAVSDCVDIQPWWDESSGELWKACGFESKPSYRTTWRRLRELAGVADAFLVAAGTLIRRARTIDPRVMAHVHFDNTEDETHAALVHDCAPGECPRRRGGHASGRGRSGAGKRPQRQDTKTFRRDRQQMNELPLDEAESEIAKHEPDTAVASTDGRFKRVRIGGCWFRTLDVDAGVRAYTGPRGATKFWHGYYSGKAVCHFTHGVIPIVESAGRQEWDIFTDHYDLVCRVLGTAPQTAIGDRGLSVEACFRKCTTNNTAPIFPWRAGGTDRTRHDKATHDRHGVPRCKHCGGPTRFKRFRAGDLTLPEEKRNPRLWFECVRPRTPECEKEQTISCATDYRLLVKLWRTDPLYHELSESHGSYEGVHDWWRDRYKVAADDIGVRPKIRDIGFHRLRADVATFVDWLRICYCAGWLGSPARLARKMTREFRERGEMIQHKMARHRARRGISTPYGEKAHELQLGQRTPPSRRPRGAPPNQTVLDVPA